MSIKLEEHGAAKVIRIAGELDSLEVQTIRGELEDALLADHQGFAVDVSEVTMVDSSGIGLLVHLYKSTHARNAKLVLVGLQGQPADMIRFLKIDQIVPSYETLDAALNALAQG